MQITLNDYLYSDFKFKGNDIGLVELFGGIGSQYRALKNAGFNIVDHVLIDADINASIGHALINKDMKNAFDFDIFNSFLNKDRCLRWLDKTRWLNKKGESLNLSKMTLKRLQYLTIAKDMNNNCGDIDLIDIDKFNDFFKRNKNSILTWSTPCQDFSVANSFRKGFDSFRGSLTYKTIDIISKLTYKPKIMLFENVKSIAYDENKVGLEKMLNELENIGYTNYPFILNAKNFDIPQNRERCFIISILGKYNFNTEKLLNYKKRTHNINSFFKNIENKERAKVNNDLFDEIDIDLSKVKDNINYPIILKDNRLKRKNVLDSRGSAQCILTRPNFLEWIYFNKENRFRKFTSLECLLLMGFTVDDYHKMIDVLGKNTVYKVAGNSIVVNVLEEIFKQLKEE